MSWGVGTAVQASKQPTAAQVTPCGCRTFLHRKRRGFYGSIMFCIVAVTHSQLVNSHTLYKIRIQSWLGSGSVGHRCAHGGHERRASVA